MDQFSVKVFIRLRSSVLDPAGEATKEEEARSKLELLTDRLLSNPVIEDWNLQIEEI